MLKLMFDPRGTITTREYWMACAGIFALFIAIAILGTFSNFQFEIGSRIAAVLMLVSMLCLAAPYGKRLAKLGLSRWWIVRLGSLMVLIFIALNPVMTNVNSQIMDTVFGAVGTEAFSSRSVGDNLALTFIILPGILVSLIPVATVTVLLGLFKKPSKTRHLSAT